MKKLFRLAGIVIVLALLWSCGHAAAKDDPKPAAASKGGVAAASRTTPTPTPSPTPTTSPSPTPGTYSGPDPASEQTYGSGTGAIPGVSNGPDPDSDAALELLARIPIRGRAPKTGYARDQFGQAWYDLDRNGCDTRNDILRRDLIDVRLKPGTRDCVVLSGTLVDPYTAKTIYFVRGSGSSNAIEIDHVVALGDAWQKGAQQLTAGERVAFANDPLNLLAVDGPTNRKKADGDAATWLPPNTSYRCSYVARQTAVKAKYRLWMTQAEHDAIERILTDCSDEPVPDATARPIAQPVPQQTAAPAPAADPEPDYQPAPVPAPAPKTQNPAPAPAPQPPAPGPDVYYKNCTEVKALGRAPLYRGQPGYRSGLDRDGDGIACE